MTIAASDGRMLPRKRKGSLRVVIKCPERPTARIVTRGTILPQPAFVNIVLSVTIITGDRHVEEGFGLVTARTLDRRMLP